jgi:hypothetical protein
MSGSWKWKRKTRERQLAKVFLKIYGSLKITAGENVIFTT